MGKVINMYLYRLTQDDRDGYDTYDSMVVAALTAEDATTIGPRSDYFDEPECDRRSWARHPSRVSVELIGTAVEGTERGIILSSFNAG